MAATLSRDPVVLTDLWTDDALRLSPDQAPEIGKQAIRESNERGIRARQGLEVRSYVPETRDVALMNHGWAIEWRSFTASIVESRVTHQAHSRHGAGGVEEVPGR